MANLRTLDYGGFKAASSSLGASGWMFWSGSKTLTSSGLESTEYDGIGIEAVFHSESFFRYSASSAGGGLEMRTNTFFLGSDDSFISGSGDGSIAISSSHFELTAGGAVTMQGTITATAGGDIGGWHIGTSVLTSSNNEIALDANGPYYISSSNFQLDADGAITASAGTIGGFEIASDQINSTNDNLILKANGQITGSEVLLTAGKIGAFDLSTTEIKSTNNNLRLKATGQITSSTVLFSGGLIGGFELASDQINSTNDNLILKANGQITASAANISGKITATEGAIGSWIIEDHLVDDENKIKLDPDGAYTISSSHFQVASTGEITASAGLLGGFELNTTEINSSNDNLRLKATGEITGSNVLFTGGKIGGFELASDQINSVNDSLILKSDGQITASAGQIAGFKIDSTQMNSTNDALVLKATGQITGSGVLFTGGIIGGFGITAAEIVSANAGLRLKATGQITGSEVLFSGGEIAGFEITTDQINSANDSLILKANGQITGSEVLLTAGVIGGFALNATTISSSNDNLILRSDGQITGSTVLFDGGKIGGWQIEQTYLENVDSNGGVKLDAGNQQLTFRTGSHADSSTTFLGKIDASNNYGIAQLDTSDTSKTLFKLGEAGNEIAGWTITDSTLTGGNLILNKEGSIKSANYVSNLQGFALTSDQNGFLEVENAKIRGTLSTTVFEKESVNAVGGQLYVANSTALTGSTFATLTSGIEEPAGYTSSNYPPTETTLSVVNVTGFVANEILTAKRFSATGFSTEYMKVVSSSRFAGGSSDDNSGAIYVVRGYGSGDTAAASGSLGETPGTAQPYSGSQVIVSTGKEDTGYIRLNANPNDPTTPYIDIVERTGSGVYAVDLKARLGDLSGVTDTINGQAVSGYGLYTDNAFLKGGIVATYGSIGALEIGSDKIYVGTGTWQNANTAFYVDNTGKFSLKDKLAWDGSNLSVNGSITIGAGSTSAIDFGAGAAASASAASASAATAFTSASAASASAALAAVTASGAAISASAASSSVIVALASASAASASAATSINNATAFSSSLALTSVNFSSSAATQANTLSTAASASAAVGVATAEAAALAASSSLALTGRDFSSSAATQANTLSTAASASAAVGVTAASSSLALTGRAFSSSAAIQSNTLSTAASASAAVGVNAASSSLALTSVNFSSSAATQANALSTAASASAAVGVAAAEAAALAASASLAATTTANNALIPNTSIGLIDFNPTPAGAGLFLGADNLGYFSGSADGSTGTWQTYMSSSGDFFLTGSNGGYMNWDASTGKLGISGSIIATDGHIGGFGITTVEISSSNDALRLKANGQITGSSVLFTGGDIGPLSIDPTKLYVGTGTWGNINTPFYVDNTGALSLKDKFSWDGDNLSVNGSITIGAGSTTAVDFGAAAAASASAAVAAATAQSASLAASAVAASASLALTTTTTNTNLTSASSSLALTGLALTAGALASSSAASASLAATTTTTAANLTSASSSLAATTTTTAANLTSASSSLAATATGISGNLTTASSSLALTGLALTAGALASSSAASASLAATTVTVGLAAVASSSIVGLAAVASSSAASASLAGSLTTASSSLAGRAETVTTNLSTASSSLAGRAETVTTNLSTASSSLAGRAETVATNLTSASSSLALTGLALAAGSVASASAASASAASGIASNLVSTTAASASAAVAHTLIPNTNIGLIDFTPTPAGAGLFLGADELGYFSGSADGSTGTWQTYMSSSGDFYLNGTNGFLQWNSETETLGIKGEITVQNPQNTVWQSTFGGPSGSVSASAVGVPTGFTQHGTTECKTVNGQLLMKSTDADVQWDAEIRSIPHFNRSERQTLVIDIDILDVTGANSAPRMMIGWGQAVDQPGGNDPTGTYRNGTAMAYFAGTTFKAYEDNTETYAISSVIAAGKTYQVRITPNTSQGARYVVRELQSDGTHVTIVDANTIAHASAQSHAVMDVGIWCLRDSYDDFAVSNMYVTNTPDAPTQIDGSSIKTGLLQSTNYGNSAGSELDLTNGTIKLGGSDSPDFQVTSAGIVTASAGLIGGWSLGASTLTGGSMVIDSTGKLSTSTNANTTRIIIDGSSDPAEMSFYSGSIEKFELTTNISVTPPQALLKGSGQSMQCPTSQDSGLSGFELKDVKAGIKGDLGNGRQALDIFPGKINVVGTDDWGNGSTSYNTLYSRREISGCASNTDVNANTAAILGEYINDANDSSAVFRIGVKGTSRMTHASADGNTVGVYGSADEQGQGTAYSFYGAAGKMYNAEDLSIGGFFTGHCTHSDQLSVHKGLSGNAGFNIDQFNISYNTSYRIGISHRGRFHHVGSGNNWEFYHNSTTTAGGDKRFEIANDGGIFAAALGAGGSNWMKWDSSTGEICYVSSTEKIKKNITGLSTASMDSILLLEPVQFNLKKTNESQYGFIAEQVVSASANFASYGPDYEYDATGSIKRYKADAETPEVYLTASNAQVPIDLDDRAILAAAVAKIQQLEKRIIQLES